MIEGEQRLIERAKAGDIRCFGKLYDHYIPQIYRFVFLKTNHRADAEDLTHEVFLSAWQNLARYAHQGFPFSSWLYQIARHKVIDHYRMRKSHARLDDLDEASEFLEVEAAVAQEIDRGIDLSRVRAALPALTHDQQDVIIMRFVEDLPYPEIGYALGKSEGAVRLIQHRAIRELKRLLVGEARNL